MKVLAYVHALHCQVPGSPPYAPEFNVTGDTCSMRHISTGQCHIHLCKKMVSASNAARQVENAATVPIGVFMSLCNPTLNILTGGAAVAVEAMFMATAAGRLL